MGRGPRRPSKLDPYRPEIERLLADDATLSGVRIREQIAELGYEGSKTILDDLLRELRAAHRSPPRTFQRTAYRPGELCQFDLCEPRREIPVGWGQTRRGWLVTAELPYSRAFAAALVFSKELADIGWGMNRCLARLGALPGKLVWDREGAIHAGSGRPTDGFAAYCGELSVGWVILDPGDCQAKGALERTHRYVHGNFEAGRTFANPLDFQDQLDRWSDRINARVHRTTRTVVAERLAPSASGCGHCPPTYPTQIAASSSASPPSRSCASIETTTRSTRAWLGVASRSRPPRPRSEPPRSTPASWPVATAASSPAGFASPIPPTSSASIDCALSAGAAGKGPRSRSAPWPATTS